MVKWGRNLLHRVNYVIISHRYVTLPRLNVATFASYLFSNHLNKT